MKINKSIILIIALFSISNIMSMNVIRTKLNRNKLFYIIKKLFTYSTSDISKSYNNHIKKDPFYYVKKWKINNKKSLKELQKSVNLDELFSLDCSIENFQKFKKWTLANPSAWKNLQLTLADNIDEIEKYETELENNQHNIIQ
jgi:hypothetical protein